MKQDTIKAVPGIDYCELRCLAHRIKPVVEVDGCLFFVKEDNLDSPIEKNKCQKVLEADMLKELGKSEYLGDSYTDVLRQIPEEFKSDVSAFRVVDGGHVIWYTGLLPEVMYNQEFILCGQKFIPARSYRYGGPGLRRIAD